MIKRFGPFLESQKPFRYFKGYSANLSRKVSKGNNSLTSHFNCKNSKFRHYKGAEKVACLARSDLKLC